MITLLTNSFKEVFLNFYRPNVLTKVRKKIKILFLKHIKLFPIFFATFRNTGQARISFPSLFLDPSFPFSRKCTLTNLEKNFRLSLMERKKISHRTNAITCCRSSLTKQCTSSNSWRRMRRPIKSKLIKNHSK